MSSKLPYSKDAEKIYLAMEDRLAELWGKLTSGNYNLATQYAFEIGFKCDIDRALKKILRNTIKRKRKA